MRTTPIALALAATLAACGGNHPDGPDCTGDGEACTDSSECCTANCDEAVSLCLQPAGSCLPAGMECQSGPDCCTSSCIDFVCAPDQCVSDGESCDSDGECCSGACDGTCTPLSGECKVSGNACTDASECCSHYCLDDICNGNTSYCTQAGDVCSTDFECCGGFCLKNGDAALGLCQLAPSSGAGSCLSAGEACDDYTDGVICGGACCSRACFPDPVSGVATCQTPSGCRPSGETCFDDSDCCGGPGNPDNDPSNVHCNKIGDNPIGRCDNGNSCSPAGDICRLRDTECNESADCCAGNTVSPNGPITCMQDNLGIPRCLAAEIDCSDPSAYEGMPCASAADCCGLPCTPESTDEFAPLVCGGMTCQPMGASCTTTADCCAGLPCEIPPGQTTGFCGDTGGECAAYGQACDVLACCNDVPCENGVCGVVVP